MVIQRVCSWCHIDRDTGEKLSQEEYEKTTVFEANVSHSICPKCLNKYFPQPKPRVTLTLFIANRH